MGLGNGEGRQGKEKRNPGESGGRREQKVNCFGGTSGRLEREYPIARAAVLGIGFPVRFCLKGTQETEGSKRGMCYRNEGITMVEVSGQGHWENLLIFGARISK